MRLARVGIVGVLLFAGCSGGDRLKPGEVVLANSGTNLDFIGFESPLSRGKFAPESAVISNGVKIRIVDDIEPDDPRRPGERKVKVLVLEGEQKDVPGKVERRKVVPAG